MKRLYIALLLAALFACASPALAQRDEESGDKPVDVCATELTREKLDNPPERKTKFEVVEEPLKIRLQNVKAADQKFVAIVRIKLPFNEDTNTNGYTASSLHGDKRYEKKYRLQLFRSFYFLSRGDSGQRDDAENSFKQMLEFMPETQKPSMENVELFTSFDINRLLLTGYSDDKHRQIRILGSSPEEAEARVKVFLTFLDQGLTRPIQLALFDLREEYCQAMKKSETEADAADAMAPSIAKTLEEYADFSVEMLPDLRVQQLQLEVELAGVNARLATCEKLLKGAQSDERRKQIEDVKIAAEIELAGFEARQAKCAEFVAKVKAKQQLSAKQSEVLRKGRTAKDQRFRYAGLIRKVDSELAAFGPVTLQDNRVPIHPIEWTQQ